jgi:PTH1 family peptidyl-tRNA hydrolase
MKLIVGLGNPGDKYAGNRHNIGFMAVDEVARGYTFGPWKKRFQGLTAEGQIGTVKCILLKPATYMNESGRAAGEAMRFYKLTPADVIVIHDELDLQPGTVRVKTGGGNAGHNGLKSLTAYIGNDYKRVRLGIGHPGDRALVINYVLQDFAKADKEWLVPFLDGIARGMDRLVEGEDAAFLNEAARGRVAAKLNGAKAPASVAAEIGKAAPKIEAAPKAEKSLEHAVAAAVAASTPAPSKAAAIAAVAHGGTASGAVARVVVLPEPERAPMKPAEPAAAPVEAAPTPAAVAPAPVAAAPAPAEVAPAPVEAAPAPVAVAPAPVEAAPAPAEATPAPTAAAPAAAEATPAPVTEARAQPAAPIAAAAEKASPAQPVKGVLQAPPAPKSKGGLFGWLFHKRVRGGSGQ